MKTKLLIFGITGDLSRRKLLPALGAMMRSGETEELQIIGVSRREVDQGALLTEANATELTRFLSVFTMDLTASGDYARLRKHIALTRDEQLIVYLSVPPMAAAQIVDFLGEAQINTPNVKLLFEKPFGMDYSSAEEVIARTSRYFKEEQLYRIDHYMAKEMAQNIVTMRGGNALFGHVWNGAAIEKIEIHALETIGIEGRAGFYEQIGALRDVVQGHLMQLLALTLMEVPADFDWSELPKKRLAALESLRPADPQKAVRAQYETYQEEVANPGSQTETFVSLELRSRDPKWQDVPLVLTTGKALDRKATEIIVHFRKEHEAQSNRLIFKIQPDEGVTVELYAKKPGYDREFYAQQLSFSYPEETVLPEAYEQVLVDAIRSRKSLFTSSDEVLQSWRILQPVLTAWGMDDEPLKTYPSGNATHNICSV